MGSLRQTTIGLYSEYPRRLSDFRNVDNLFVAATNTVFSPLCLNCGKPGSPLCKKCLKMPDNEAIDFPLCIECECLSSNGITHNFCKHQCQIHSYHCPFVYSGIIKEIITKAKKGAVNSLIPLLQSPINIKLLDSLPTPDLVVPIPPSTKFRQPRLIEPTKVIGSFLGRMLNVKYIELFRKPLLSPSQKTLSKTQREQIAQNLYFKSSKIEESISGKTVLLVDDICTTGHSLKTGAKILVNSGASRAYAYSLAKDLRYNSK